MMTKSVALSQDTSSGDVKDKPLSPRLVGWTLPWRLFKEGGCLLGKQWSQDYSKASETKPAERNSRSLSEIQLSLRNTVSRMASIFSGLKLPMIQVLCIDFKAEVHDQVYYKFCICWEGLLILVRKSQCANTLCMFDFRLWSVFQSHQEDPLQVQKCPHSWKLR